MAEKAPGGCWELRVEHQPHWVLHNQVRKLGYMNIWVVNHYAIPPTEPGGTRHFALAKQLTRLGHQVTIIAANFNHATRTHIDWTNRHATTGVQCEGVQFLFLPVPAYRRKAVRLCNMLAFAMKVWHLGSTRLIPRPDIVIGSSLTLFAALAACRVAERFRVPFVLEIRDLWPQTLIDLGMSRYHPAVLGFGMIERYLYRKADKVVTLLPQASELIAQRGAAPEDITWIPNGVDLTLFPPLIGGQNRQFTVMYAGSHGLSDALDPVLDAAAILNRRSPSKFQFRFLGDGPAKSGLQLRAGRENIENITFEAPIPKFAMASTLAGADAFIISLKRTNLYRYGISPNKLHEYMAAGRPTVVAGYAHNNPVAEAEAGLTVAPEDPNAIAEAVEKLARMSGDERRDMGVRARRYIERFNDYAKLGDDLDALLKAAVEWRGAGVPVEFSRVQCAGGVNDRASN